MKIRTTAYSLPILKAVNPAPSTKHLGKYPSRIAPANTAVMAENVHSPGLQA